MKRACGVTLLLVSLSISAFADGGRLRFSRTAGPFLVTLFTTPEPLTPGPADFSVMIQDAKTGDILPDAHVMLTLTPPGASSSRLVAIAAHGIATNRLLQAAELNLPSNQTTWLLHLDIRSGAQMAAIDAPIEIENSSRQLLLIWIFAILPLAAILLFVLHQRQKMRLSKHSTLAKT